ncbi:hypothetical protein GCM10010472_02580 [Pseudonocardia halophobica]|uniref:Uncharacterized protein n=1 Tax=Pseudonocardia halophobica TaxID=29401 RepID=A0A9W6KZM3_9PSEU|nr:hypothetical protein GCM10017577_17380 [Pseudonocardia halophobica]
MGVHVDEAGRHHRAVGVDLASSGSSHTADLDYPLAYDGDVGRPRIAAVPVDHGPAPDH